jgi:hypothetical protein
MNSDQAWPLISQMMMMIGIGIPISHRNSERISFFPALQSVNVPPGSRFPDWL